MIRTSCSTTPSDNEYATTPATTTTSDSENVGTAPTTTTPDSISRCQPQDEISSVYENTIVQTNQQVFKKIRFQVNYNTYFDSDLVWRIQLMIIKG